ncbi:NFAT activation molecule 1 [Eleutherodactylus coqui]|uniref:NFAT activation molecule 1 n=1 Tax=Eleutherodactylus coqui TaxID=57060 RepID=UPI003462C163
MEDAALTLILLLGPCLTHACTVQSITQVPPVLVTLTENEVIITCYVRFTGEIPINSSFLYRAGNIVRTRKTVKPSSTNVTVTHQLRVTGPPEVYYCHVTCAESNIRGHGTYIYVRDSGYVAPSSASYKLCCGLITLCILLLLLAASGTYLVLPFFWKREVKPEDSPPQTREQSSAVNELSRSRPVVEDAGSSLYTSLEPRSEEIYDVMEDETKTKETGTPKKHRREIHEVVPRSPVRKLQAKVSFFQEKPQMKPKPKENISENTVYENVRR